MIRSAFFWSTARRKHPGTDNRSSCTMKFTVFASSLLLILLDTNAYAPSVLKTRSLTSFQLDARRPFISGNWKLNPQTKDEAIKLAGAIAQTITPSSPDCDVAIFTPYVFLESAMQAVGGKLQVGAEVSQGKPSTGNGG
jgi:hypothetical protein